MSAATPPPRLYYMPRTRSTRVLWMLEEIGKEYDLTQIAGAERRSAEHMHRHPLGRVPAQIAHPGLPSARGSPRRSPYRHSRLWASRIGRARGDESVTTYCSADAQVR